jgi:hypothetical protein
MITTQSSRRTFPEWRYGGEWIVPQNNRMFRSGNLKEGPIFTSNFQLLIPNLAQLKVTNLLLTSEAGFEVEVSF